MTSCRTAKCLVTFTPLIFRVISFIIRFCIQPFVKISIFFRCLLRKLAFFSAPFWQNSRFFSDSFVEIRVLSASFRKKLCFLRNHLTKFDFLSAIHWRNSRLIYGLLPKFIFYEIFFWNLHFFDEICVFCAILSRNSRFSESLTKSAFLWPFFKICIFIARVFLMKFEFFPAIIWRNSRLIRNRLTKFVFLS